MFYDKNDDKKQSEHSELLQIVWTEQSGAVHQSENLFNLSF